MNRRAFLTGTASAVSAPLVSGCVARPPGTAAVANRSANRPVADGGGEGTETRSPGDGTESAFGNRAESTPSTKGPVRGESDVDVQTRAVEEGENVEYVPEDDAVRYVAAWRNTNPAEMKEGEPPEREPVYEAVPFEWWGETNCFTAAAQAAADHAAGELGANGIGHGISSFVIDGRDRTAFVGMSTTLDRDGDVTSEPVLEFDVLVAATPATVDATYVLGDREYSLNAPIHVQRDVLRQA